MDAEHASNTERNGTGGESDRRLGEAKKGAGGAVVYCDATEMPCWRINVQDITLHSEILFDGTSENIKKVIVISDIK